MKRRTAREERWNKKNHLTECVVDHFTHHSQTAYCTVASQPAVATILSSMVQSALTPALCPAKMRRQCTLHASRRHCSSTMSTVAPAAASLAGAAAGAAGAARGTAPFLRLLLAGVAEEEAEEPALGFQRRVVWSVPALAK